jgi:hypothetical protein
MTIPLPSLLEDFVEAMKLEDESGRRHKNFRPGIGPYGESDALRAALAIMKFAHPDKYQSALIKRRPDLLIPDEWQLEFKVIRPFGDNGKEAENWSQNLLHPYPGNTSSIGDCIKLLESCRPERKGIIVFGYEHDPAKVPLEPCIRRFELLASQLEHIALSPRIQIRVDGLVHPVHKVLWTYAWQVLGKSGIEP